MGKILHLVIVLLATNIIASCHPKACQTAEQQAADTSRSEATDRRPQADSLSNAQAARERIEAKIAFLQDIYAHVMYPPDINTHPAKDERYAHVLKAHLSDRLKSALASYDDGIDDGPATDADDQLALYLFRDEADYGADGPAIRYTYEGDDWYRVDINGTTTVMVRVEDAPKGSRHFVISGLVNKTYDIDIH